MKTNTTPKTNFGPILAFSLFGLLLGLASAEEALPAGFVQGPALSAGWPQGSRPISPQKIRLTPEEREKRAAKIWGRADLDADMNYDGEVANDSSDDGNLESSPPGLIIGKGEMSKMLLRVSPYRRSIDAIEAKKSGNSADMMVRVEARAIYLASKDGKFPSPDVEDQKAGHIRIWSDEKKSMLLIDTKAENKRSIEWPLDSDDAFRSVYVEAVDAAVPGSVQMVSLTLFKKSQKTSATPGNSSDFVLVSPRAKSARRDDGPSGEGLPCVDGYGKYCSFNKDETGRDGHNVWIVD
ncbi:MAG: hypothetical protein JNJ83_05875 [Verrucomicrobiaceae bacterium]|nr:hypothetical protein [Verrucomicrobiaceae bacterium]